jgi:hypothetical protein
MLQDVCSSPDSDGSVLFLVDRVSVNKMFAVRLKISTVLFHT